MATGNQSDKDWQAALKAVEAFDKKIKDTEKSAQRVKGVFSNIATELFGISGSAFFKETSLSIDEIIQKEKELAKATNDLNSVNKKMADDMSGAFGDLESGLKKISKTMSSDVSKAMGAIDFAKTTDIATLTQVNKLLEDETLSLEKKKKLQDLQKEFQKDEISFQEKNKKLIEEQLEANPDFMKHASEKDRFQAASIISQGGFNELVERELDLSGKVLRLSTQKNGEEAAFSETQMKNQIIAGEMVKSVGAMNDELKKGTKESFSLAKGFEDIAKNLAAGILPKMMEYDQAISDAGRDFGFVNAKSLETSANMANLGQSAARFGMSMGDALQMMGQMGEELSSIDQNSLANSVEHFTAIEKATGISSKEITTIAGEMMRAGKSAAEVEGYMEGANKTAKRFGVNTKKVLEGVSKNIDKMRTMGFQGGVESLTKMVATAERLRMNVDEIFDMSDKARSIEGAMDMAAELQLAGGSFANIDPMSLLAAARKGPEELQKILTQMGGDIGTFNKETGELEFDAIDADRLKMMADATGVSVDSMQKMLQKQAGDMKKMDFMPDMQMGPVLDSEGKELDQDMLNNMLLDSVDVNGDALEGGLLDEAGVGSLEELTAEQAQSILQDKINKEASLAEQAEQNQSFQESITAFKDAIMNLFVVFEPVIAILTSFVQTLNTMPGFIKVIAAALIGFVAFGPKLIKGFGGFRDSVTTMVGGVKDFASGFKEGGLKGGFKGAFGKKEGLSGTESKDATPGKGGGGLESLAKGLAKMGGKGVLKGIGNTALAGPALLMMLPGMPTLGLMIAIGAGGALLEAGFKALSSGISSFGNKKNIWKGIAAIAVAGPALVVFSAALLPLALMIPLGLGGPLIVAAFQALSNGLSILGNNFSSVAKGAIALILVGASLIPFAIAAQIMTGVDWLSVLAGVGVLGLVVLGLMGLGALLMGPQILFLLLGVATLIMVGASLLIASVGLLAAGMAFQKLSEVNWDGLSSMGSALMGSVPGLLAFSLASMAFLNPFALLGILAMTATLGLLAMVMIPLGIGMTMAADGMERFANGLTKLQAAANSLDFERLEALKELSIGMATAGAGGGMGDELAKIADAIVKMSGGAGGGKGGGTQKIQVDLKLNGRDLQSIIIDDTEIVS